MKFILTKIPVVEDLIVAAFTDYIKELRWHEMYPNHKSINVSNDHPFEELLGSTGDSTPPHLFPSATIVSSTDGEVPGMGKGWAISSLEPSDLDGFEADHWFVADGALADLKTALAAKSAVHGLRHATMWRDNGSIEIWADNMQVKNDLYSLALGFLTGPKILQLKQEHDVIIHSGSVNGQRSGYYNFDFGRVLYGGRISFQADYSVLQAVYDTDIETLEAFQHSIQEVVYGD